MESPENKTIVISAAGMFMVLYKKEVKAQKIKEQRKHLNNCYFAE